MSPQRQAAKALKDLKYRGAPQRRPEANQGYPLVAPNPFWIDFAGAVRRFLGPDVPDSATGTIVSFRAVSGSPACSWSIAGYQATCVAMDLTQGGSGLRTALT